MDLSRHEGEIPFPLPITSKYVGGGEQEKSHHARKFHVHHPIAATNTDEKEKENENEIPNNNNNSNCSSGEKGGGRGGAPAVKYRECLKNHAASIGGNATDGCGEFMPSGEDGTMEALKCSACNCHRNFHRKEVDGSGGDQSPLDLFHFLHHQQPGRKVVGQKGILINNSLQFPISSPHQMIMPVAAAGGEYSEEMDGGFTAAHRLATPLTKKRFRTKFTPEQKEKMLRFAERIGWRLQKQEEGVVQQFCQEIGVKRRVLKVWMHNNKHNLAKKNSVSISISPAPANFTGLPESLRGVD